MNREMPDESLLALLTGWPEAKAAALLRHSGSLAALCSDGARLAPRVRRRLAAAVELGRRLFAAPLPRGRTVGGAGDVAAHFRSRLRGEKREHLFALLLDSAHRLIRVVEVSVGTLDSAPAVPRDALREAVRESAAAIIFAHNHPSGDATPSAEDRAATAQLRMACELLGIRLLDHVIIGDPGWSSVR